MASMEASTAFAEASKLPAPMLPWKIVVEVSMEASEEHNFFHSFLRTFINYRVLPQPSGCSWKLPLLRCKPLPRTCVGASMETSIATFYGIATEFSTTNFQGSFQSFHHFCLRFQHFHASFHNFHGSFHHLHGSDGSSDGSGGKPQFSMGLEPSADTFCGDFGGSFQ